MSSSEQNVISRSLYHEWDTGVSEASLERANPLRFATRSPKHNERHLRSGFCWYLSYGFGVLAVIQNKGGEGP